MSHRELGIQLHLSKHQAPSGLNYQKLSLELTRRDRILYPEELRAIELPPGIDSTQGVVISGRGPIWLYGHLVHELHPTAWVACHDPRKGAVVVATHTREVSIGQVLQLAPPASTLHPALLVVGPPDSGKSVLSHALFRTLLAIDPNIYLQRANWDGEGNYVFELPADTDPEQFKAANKGGLTPEFFPDRGQAILKLRLQKNLTIVDVGGMVQPEKQPILEACTHYLIISSQPEAVEPWHEFCRDRGNLIPLAVIHSTLDSCETIHQQHPYLEITCGPWACGSATTIPAALMERVKGLLTSSTP